MPWQDWIGPIVSGAAQAYFANRNADQYNQQAAAANQPQETNTSTTQTPWDPFVPHLVGAGNEAARIYNQRLGVGPPPSSGGGGHQGASQGMRDLANYTSGLAQDNPWMGGAQDYLNGIFGGDVAGTNPMMQQTFNAAQNNGNPNLDRYMQMGFGGGFTPESGYQHQFIQQLMGGNPTGPFAPNPGTPEHLTNAGQASFLQTGPDGQYQTGGSSYGGGGRSGASSSFSSGRPSPTYGSGGGLAGGSVPAGTPANQLPYYGNDELTGYFSDVLGGNYLDHNQVPGLQGIMDEMASRAEDSFNTNRARLNAASEGAGRMGSSFYQSQMGDTFRDYQDSLNSANNRLLFDNYNAERDRMNQVAGLSNQRDASIWGDRTQRHGIDTSAATSRSNAAMAANSAQNIANIQAQNARDIAFQGMASDERQLADQLLFGRQNMLLGAMDSLGNNTRAGMGLLGNAIGQDVQNDQFGLGIMGNMANAWGQQGLGALGMVPGLSGAQFDGLGTAWGMQQGIGAMDSHAAAQNAAARARDAQNRYLYDNHHQQDAFNDYLGNIMRLGSMGGNSTTVGITPGAGLPMQSTGAATVAGLLGGLAGGFAGMGSQQGAPPVSANGGGYQAPPAWANDIDPAFNFLG